MPTHQAIQHTLGHTHRLWLFTHFAMLTMCPGVQKVAQAQGSISIKMIKSTLFLLGNLLIILRILTNAVLTFIFLYVDIISRQSDPTRDDIILVAIAIYGSAIIAIKTLLAVYHHLKWLIFERCCITELVRPNEEKRVDVIDRYWRN